MHAAATGIWWSKVCKYVCTAYLAQRTQLMCWLREKRNFCRWTAHTLMVLSSEAVTRVCPSPEKLTLRTEAVWALKNVDSPFLYTYTNTDNKKKKTWKHVGVQKCDSGSVLAEAQDNILFVFINQHQHPLLQLSKAIFKKRKTCND